MKRRNFFTAACAAIAVPFAVKAAEPVREILPSGLGRSPATEFQGAYMVCSSWSIKKGYPLLAEAENPFETPLSPGAKCIVRPINGKWYIEALKCE